MLFEVSLDLKVGRHSSTVTRPLCFVTYLSPPYNSPSGSKGRNWQDPMSVAGILDCPSKFLPEHLPEAWQAS